MTKKQARPTRIRRVSKDLEIVQSDMSPEETQILEDFVAEGLPGIGSIPESDIFGWLNLYLSGKSYQEIANHTKSDIKYILYMSRRYRWLEKKTTHLNAIASKMSNRLLEVKLESVNFLADLVSYWHKSHGDKIKEYIRTNDPEHIKGLDMKSLDKYFKSLDMLDKLTTDKPGKDGGPSKMPNFVFNFGSAEITREDDSTVSIAPKKDNRNILAEMTREKERAEGFEEDEE